MFWILTYVASIVAVNVGFAHVPLVDLGALGFWPPMSLLVGVIFVIRDFAQRAVGHWVLPAMLVGLALSYVMADPYVALASACAFAVSELADWAIYTVTRRPFHQRVLASSAIGAPLDSAIFLLMIGHASFVGIAVMSVSKMFAALLIWAMPQSGDKELTQCG